MLGLGGSFAGAIQSGVAARLAAVVDALARRPFALLALLCLAGALAGPLAPAASAEPMWTTYHRDAGRSGDDPDASEGMAPVEIWQSRDLGAPIWSQPL